MMKMKQGFTLIELVVTIVVLGILATIVTVATTQVLANSRNEQRNSSMTVIAEALEKYHTKNGEYPSCAALQGSPDNLRTILDIDQKVVKAPLSTQDNSIICGDITASTPGDVFAFVGDGTTKCSSGSACRLWTLKYKAEGSNEIKTVVSRYNTPPPVVATAPASITTTTLSGSSAQANASAVTCSEGSAQYQINLQVNDGTWDMGSWNTITSRTTPADQGSKYAYRTDTRCVLIDGTEGSPTTGLASSQIQSINTPSALVVSATSTGSGTANAVTWSWSASTCPAGTQGRFSSALYRDDASAWRAWGADNTTATRVQATDYQGYEYRMKARVRCVTPYAQSAYSLDSNAPSYIRTIDKPGVATNFYNQAVDEYFHDAYGYGHGQSYDVISRYMKIGWTPPTCGLGTVPIRNVVGFSSNNNGGGSRPAIWTDAPNPMTTDYMNGTNWNRWVASTLPVGSVNWGHSEFSWLSPQANPNTTDVSPSSYPIQNTSVQQVNSSVVAISGWNPVNANTPYVARVMVMYACVNTVTDRTGFYGNYAVSSVRSQW